MEPHIPHTRTVGLMDHPQSKSVWLRILRISSILVLLSGCSYLRPSLKEEWTGKKIEELIEASRIPDRQQKLANGKEMYQWTDCRGHGETTNGEYESSYRCKHLVAITKDGVIEQINRR